MTHVVEVAAAILLRDGEQGREFLLAQRPPDKVYAGYWEFPGGKLEAGESFRDALVRELHEELGIAITAATPWLCREFIYPHAHVRLKFFRVSAWQGEITPSEHTGCTWTPLGDAPAVAPVLPANGPILRALALPDIYAVSNAADNGIDAELERIRRGLRAGVRLFQLRDKTLPAATRQRFAERAAALVHAAPGARLLVNDDEALARAIGADGVHLSSSRLQALSQRPDGDWVAASCHDAADLERATQLGLDFVVLGPLLPTDSHPGTAGIGWDAFATRIERLTLPVYALGGLRQELLATAQSRGAHGIALLRNW